MSTVSFKADWITNSTFYVIWGGQASGRLLHELWDSMPFDEYVSLLTEGETIEGMLNKLNIKINEYCDKKPDPKPKLCTDKDKLQEFKPDEESEDDKQNDIVQETESEKPDMNKNDVIIESFLKKYPGMKNIMKIIENN